MALIDKLALIELHKKDLFLACRTCADFQTRVYSHRANVSDKDTIEAINNLFLVTIELHRIMGLIVGALEEINKESLKKAR